MHAWNEYTAVTCVVTDYDQDGHVVGAHEEPVSPDSKDEQAAGGGLATGQAG